MLCCLQVLNFSQNFRSWFLHLIPWLKFQANNQTFLRSAHIWLDKGLYFGIRTCVRFLGLRCTQVYKPFLNWFALTNFLCFVSLANVLFATFTQKVPMIPNKIFENIFLNYISLTNLKNIFKKIFLQSQNRIMAKHIHEHSC